MAIKKNDVFYRAQIEINSEKNEKSYIDFTTHIVSTINKKGVYLKEKCICTWGKNSTKANDYGWLSLSSEDRKYFVKHFCGHNIEEQIKDLGYRKSKAAAYRAVLHEVKKLKRDILRIHTQVEKAIYKHQKTKK